MSRVVFFFKIRERKNVFYLKIHIYLTHKVEFSKTNCNFKRSQATRKLLKSDISHLYFRNVELQETLLMVTLELVKDYIPEDILKRWTTN